MSLYFSMLWAYFIEAKQEAIDLSRKREGNRSGHRKNDLWRGRRSFGQQQLLDVQDGELLDPTGGRHNHQVAHLMPQQRFPHRRLVGNKASARLCLIGSNQGIAKLAAIGGPQLYDGAKRDLIAGNLIDRLGRS